MQLLKEARIHVVERDENPLTRPHRGPPNAHWVQRGIERACKSRKAHSDEQPNRQNRVVKAFFEEEVPRTIMMRARQCARAADRHGTSMKLHNAHRRQGRERNTDHICLISCPCDCTKSNYNYLKFVQKLSDHPLYHIVLHLIYTFLQANQN